MKLGCPGEVCRFCNSTIMPKRFTRAASYRKLPIASHAVVQPQIGTLGAYGTAATTVSTLSSAVQKGSNPLVRYRRFSRQLPPHGIDPIRIEVQRLGNRVIDLMAHRILVHLRER